MSYDIYAMLLSAGIDEGASFAEHGFDCCIAHHTKC